jgi:regulatory protein
MEKKERKYTDAATALIKMQQFCAYQERSHNEVRSKLIDIGVYGDTIDEIIIELIQENFLNEERFAKAFARGKFNIKKWGRLRIKQELKLHKISDYCVRKAMEEITEEDYFGTLHLLVTKKSELLKEQDTFKLRQKLFAYTHSKGYETSIINEVLDDFFKNLNKQ